MESRAEENVKRRAPPCKQKRRPEGLAGAAVGSDVAGGALQAGNGSKQASCSPPPPPPPSSSFPRRCARFVKEQRARLYIVRRCVTMLACWRDYP
ncbi:hypothetical protein E2562_007759 [Oryza meyeriana var. granulata]|uniref:Uncharacterized protein n=1 Tax=Oryza meyeriana var. granulata TaxID=110450 RepID=A0A6G1EGK0_9ORYZ|nr:hypothetical protein E2562_007759 [Oryza meyeriana var. granulata]